MLELLTGETGIRARSGGGMPAQGALDPGMDEFETLVLWAMRQWMCAHIERRCATGSVLEVFEASGLVPALAPLNRMMTLLTLASRRDLAIAAASPAPVSIDEMLLLRVLHDARNGQRDLAESKLGMWMEAENARATANAMMRLTERIYRHPSRMDA